MLSPPYPGFAAEPSGPGEYTSRWVFIYFAVFQGQVPSGNSLVINDLNKISRKSAMVPTKLTPNPRSFPPRCPRTQGCTSTERPRGWLSQNCREGKTMEEENNFYSLTAIREHKCFVPVCPAVCPSVRTIDCHPEN